MTDTTHAQRALPPELEGLPRFMDRMARVVRNYGERTAFVDGERSVTYAQLDEESGKVYRWLKRHGIGTEDLVLVVMPRSAGFFSCVGGVLRAGAAFVPLESTYPQERINFIREDAGCACVLDQALFERIMAEEDYLAGYEATSVRDACFAVYTSGSTGNPKGVLHEYASLDVQACRVPEQDELPVSIRGAFEPFYFIAVLYFGIPNMLSAATVHIIDRSIIRNLKVFSHFIEERQIETLFIPPSYVRMYKNPSPSLKAIQIGSESANMLYYPGGVPGLHNTYGMSESGFFLLECDLDRAYDIAPVGRPTVPGIDLHLEDDDGNRVEGPGEGEICYRNLSFRGYINLPEKTTEAIRDGYFHTGDLARRDERGLYYIRGRKDDMFKINGNRIEPAEIERRVREATGLTQVVAKGFVTSRSAFICTYFLKDEAKQLGIWDGHALTCDLSVLHGQLPDYMVPAHYVALDEFPTNANGKLAKMKLEPPDLASEERTYVEPEGDVERLVCDAMAEALGLERVGATEDFYRTGGDSMHAVVLITELANAGYDVELADLYAARTPRALAQILTQGQTGASDYRANKDEALHTPQPVLANQLEDVRQLAENPESVMYNLPQLLLLKSGTDLERLRAALDKVFFSHPALLATFTKADGAYHLTYDEGLFEPTQIVTMTDAEFKAAMASLVAPFQGFGQAPHRRALYHTDSADYLFWDVHHAIADGGALALLRDQVFACCEDPDYRIPADEYFWCLERMNGEQTDEESVAFLEARDYYDRHLERAGGMGTCSCVLDPDLPGPNAGTTNLVRRGSQTRTADGGSTLWVAATAIAMARLNGQSSALVHVAYHGRNSQAQRQAVGMFATSVPVFLNLADQPSAREVMEDVADQLAFGMAHCTYPYQQLHPTPQHATVIFNYQKNTMDLGPIEALVDKRIPLGLEQNGFLICGLIDLKAADALTWYCGYDTGWYSEGRMNAFQAEFDKAASWLKEQTHA